MKFYVENSNYKIEIDAITAEKVKFAMEAFSEGINNASNISEDEKKSRLAKYIAKTFLEDEESEKLAKESYFYFMHLLKLKLEK